MEIGWLVRPLALAGHTVHPRVRCVRRGRRVQARCGMTTGCSGGSAARPAAEPERQAVAGAANS